MFACCQYGDCAGNVKGREAIASARPVDLFACAMPGRLADADRGQASGCAYAGADGENGPDSGLLVSNV